MMFLITHQNFITKFNPFHSSYIAKLADCRISRVYDRKNFEPVDCSDNLSNCRYMRHLCERIEHQQQMKADCSYTCNFCDYIETPADIPRECNDAEMDCPKKKYLCYVEGRHSYYMWRNCKRTCGYCPEYSSNNTLTNDTYSSEYYYHY